MKTVVSNLKLLHYLKISRLLYTLSLLKMSSKPWNGIIDMIITLFLFVNIKSPGHQMWYTSAGCYCLQVLYQETWRYY